MQLTLPVVNMTDDMRDLQLSVREFINDELSNDGFVPRCDSWLAGFSPEFSKRLAAKGWVGMTVPEQFGGGGRSAMERYVVTEELLAAGAPVAAHWVSDRQTAPLLLKYGTSEQKKHFLHEICRGESYFSIGLSEPNAGSDLASISTKAEKVGDDWILNGSKTWTSGAHKTDHMIVLCRTSNGETRQAGLSQIMVRMSTPGVTVRPILLMTGEHHFNEVFFEDVRIPGHMLIGEEGDGWNQSMTELAFERSGPERFLSTFPLLEEAVKILKKDSAGKSAEIEIGKTVATVWSLRRMSLGVAQMLDNGQTPDIAASLVKDIGTQLENEVINTVRLLIDCLPNKNSQNHYQSLLTQAILHSPGFTIRGGTTEILRSIISRGVGV